MNGYDFYLKGKKYLLDNPTVAKHFFEESYRFPNTRYKSLLQLITLSIKNGNYKKARKLIDKHMVDYKNNSRFNILRQYVEHDEYNFDKQSSLIYKDINAENYGESLINLAERDVQIGNFPQAEERFYELLDYTDLKLRSLFNIITIKILNGEYDEAYSILRTIDVKQLSDFNMITYKDLRIYLNFFRGVLKSGEVKRGYKYARLFDQDNKLLFTHLEKHKTRRDGHDDSCFLRDLNFYDLIEEVNDFLDEVNPIHRFGVDKYRFNMGRTIGLLDKKKLQDICVVTVINTKTIITMYPISLSADFDSEGYGHKLLLKNNK